MTPTDGVPSGGLTLVETAEAASTLTASDNPVALSPWAAAALDRQAVPYLRLDDFYTIDEREELGLRNAAMVDRLGVAVDDLADQVAPELGRFGFRPGLASFYYLKIQRDTVTQRLFELERLIARTGVSVIRYVDYPPQVQPRRLDFMGESLYARLLPIAARRAGIELVKIEEQGWPFVTSAEEHWPIGKVARRARQLGSELIRSGRLLRGRSSGLVACLDARLVPLVAGRTPFAPLLWRGGGPRAFRLGGVPQPLLMRSLAGEADVPGRLRRELESWYGNGDAAWREWSPFLDFDGYGLRPVLESRLVHLLLDIVPELARIFAIARNRLPELETRLVLGRAYSEPADRIIAQAARSAGIPVAGYDHGATGYFFYPMDRHTMSGVPDYRLVWGEGVARTAERRYPEGSTTIAVGSTMLESLVLRKAKTRTRSRTRIAARLGLDPRRPTVVYAITSMSTNTNYISNRICSDVMYYQCQRRIVNVLMGFPDVQAIVKLHPTSTQPQSPIVEYIAESRSANCICVSATPLDEMLDIGDLFLNDSPTTTLLQMLTTGRPVLALNNGGLALEPEAELLLRRAVTYCDTIEELEAALSDRLTRLHLGDSSAPGAAAAFLAEYGTAGGDGRSAERIAEAITRIATPEDSTKD